MFLKKTLFKKVIAGILLFATVFGLRAGEIELSQSQNNQLIGNSTATGERGGTWYSFDDFSGFQTKYDPTKISDGANANGQNTTINEGDRISVRNMGYELFPTTDTATTSASGIKSMHTFRKRDGENILMRSYLTYLEYFEEGNDTWEIISSSFSSGYKFGFADYNINTDLVSYVYFGNSQQPGMRWTGNHTLTNGALAGGEATITVDSTNGFTAAGTLTLCNTNVSYTGKTLTTFTGAAGTPACADNKGVIEAATTTPNQPRGNIYMTADNRLWIAGVTSTPQAAYFSKYGDATDFTTTTLISDNTDVASGIFNLGEGGGGITAMIQDESAIYLFKKSIIRKATLNDTIYTLGTLKPFDGKSQTIGSQNSLTTFSSGNEIFFVTPDKQIMRLARVETVDYPQTFPISDVIKPTIDALDFASSTGIVFQDKAYFSAKSSNNATYNDTVLVYNLQGKFWDSPIVGWSVADFSVYDHGDGEALYFGDAATGNVYRVNTDPLDYIYGFASNWRSKQFAFGAPQIQKVIDSVYVEGYISPATDLTVSLLLDEDGYTQIYSTVIHGASSTYIYSSADYNVFGFNVFGFERFGTQDDLSGKKKFRVYLNKDFTPIPFYNAQIEFASDGENQEWEVTNYALNVRPFSQQAKPSLFKSFR